MVNIDQIKAGNISDTVGRFVKLTKRGTNYVGLCPFHKERTPSFFVDDAKGRYKCFGCGASGDVIDFIKANQNTDFNGAILILTGESAGRYATRSPRPGKKTFLIPKSRILTKYNPDYKLSTLYHFLIAIFSDHMDVVERELTAYHVMSQSSGLNVFPYLDVQGNYRQVKELTADPISGKRNPEVKPKLNGVSMMSEAEMSEHRLVMCLFGEHLINVFTDIPIAIVESEKTAIAMKITEAIYSPNDRKLWLATGGKFGVNLSDKSAMLPLKNRVIYLIPDNDAIEEWQKHILTLSGISYQFKFIDSIGNNEKSDTKVKYDIWDYTLENLKGCLHITE